MANLRNLLFFTLIALIGYSTSSSIDKECAKGVTYWCQHVMNAKKCNAVNFCIQSVWEKHDVRIDSNPLCDDCKDWVVQARDLITNKKVTDEVIKALEYSCQLCPNDEGRAKCQEIIEGNVKDITALIISKMNPDQICSAIHLCNNPKFTEMFNSPKVEKKDQELLPFTCGQCNVIGKHLEKKFKALGHDDVLEAALKFCGETSSFSDSCMNVVFKNFDDIYGYLSSRVKNQFLCKATCAGHNQYTTEGISEITFDSPQVPCRLCEQLMLHLRELLIANTSEIEFKNVLQGFCTQMPKITDECISITEQYYAQIYQFLSNGLDANKTCVMIGICDSSERQLNAPSMPLLSSDSFPPLTVDLVFDDNSIRLSNDGKLCTACEYAMNLIHEEMGKNTVEDEIIAYAKESCKKLPKYSKECVMIINMYGGEIADAIYQKTDPRLVCPLVKLCPPNHDIDTLEKNAVGEKPTCSFCLLALQEIKDVIKSNNTRDNIEKALDKLCDHLSNNLKAQCVQFVHDHSKDVVDMMLANFTPQEACVFLKLCNNNEPVRKRVKIVKAVGSSSDESEDFPDTSSEGEVMFNPQCKLCKQVIKKLIDRIDNTKSRDEVRHQLENVCSKVRKFKKECDNFVEKYSDKIVDLVMQQLGPDAVCRQLIFCVTEENKDMQDYDIGLDILRIALSKDDSLSSSSSSSSSSSESSLLSNPQCDLCKAVIQMIEQRVIDHKSKDEIRRKLEESCSHLKKFSKECKTFVDKYSDRIVDLVSQELEPEQVCKDLIFCVTKDEREIQDYDVGLDIIRMSFTSDEDEVEVDKEETEKSNPGCVLCEFVIQTIEDDLNDNKTDEAIKHAVKNVCSKMPSSIGSQCNLFVDYYFDMIIALIETSPPAAVCNRMKLCPSTLEAKLEEIKGDIYTCAVCRGVVEGIDSIIEDPTVDTNLENFEEKICQKFAGKFKNKCHNIASTYGVAIINALKTITESDQICFKYDLCKNTGGQVMLN